MLTPLLLPTLLACTPAGTSDIVPKTGSSSTSTLTGFPPLGADLVVTDDSVHTFDAQWILPSATLRADLDATLTWSAVATDGWGEARDPATFQVAALFRTEASRADTARALAVDQLDALVTDAWTADVAGDTQVRLSALQGPGGAFDPAVDLVEDAGATLLFLLCDRDGARLDPRTGLTIEPRQDEAGSVLPVPDAVPRIEWTAALDGDTLRTEATYDDWPLDWSAVTTDGYGQPYDNARADELFLARYDDVDEADDLSARLVDLPATAVDYWTAPLSGTSAHLSDLAGFDALASGGIYLVGARCTTCLGPAPLWVAGLEVR
ncbi:MAG: hypothetical protein R3F59_24200 [Myxococcota bacterium]